jgi:hypothetical protein
VDRHRRPHLGGVSRKKKRRHALLLHDLACALNAAERAGLNPRLKHGVIYTEAGYVVPFGRHDAWVPRTLRKKLTEELCGGNADR